jgi:8-oxo-dGTP diphosphatase
MEVPRVAVSVDLVILTVRASQLSVLVWRRHAEPHLGRWALPGGFIRLDEDLPGTASRVLAERAGLPDAPVHLEQLQTYGYPDRDPRARVVAVAYLGLAPDLPAPVKPRMSWEPVDALSEMAFDHLRILQDGVERARAKLEYTTLGAAFCQDTFTVAELRNVYEIVWGTPLDPRNFHRKVTGAERFLVDTGTAISSGGRPAVLYRRGDTDVLHPPMLRPRPAPRVFQGVEPVRQSPGGPVDLPDGERQRETPGQAAGRHARRAREVEPTVPTTRPGGSGASFPGSDREDNDVRADTTVPTDS